MDDHIIIRPAKKEDTDLIVEFALHAINNADTPEFAKDIGENLVDRITCCPENVIIAVDTKQDNQIIGYIEIDPKRTRPGKAFYISGLYVLHEYRKKGIGKQLINKMIEFKCKDNEQLRVEAFNKEELKYWEKVGFKIHHYSLYYES